MEPDATDAPSPPADDRPPRAGRRAALEDRVSKLEAAVARLPDPDTADEHVADRVIAKLLSTARESGPLRLSAADGLLLDGGDPVPPPAADPPPVAAPPRGAVLRPPEVVEPTTRRGWVLVELWSEMRLLPRMYFDPRYRLSRTGQFALPIAVGLFVANYLFFGRTFDFIVIGPVAECVVNVLIGVVLYKIMVREQARYKEVIDYLGKYGFR